MPQSLGVYKTRRLPYPPALVYETWIDPSVRVPPITHMEAEVRVGGAVRIEVSNGSMRSVMRGSYLEVEPHTRLRYTWQWAHWREETVVTVDFATAGSGCRVTLTHEGFTTAADREAHHLAWDAYLRQLEYEITTRAEVT